MSNHRIPWKTVEAFLREKPWDFPCTRLALETRRIGRVSASGRLYRARCRFYDGANLTRTRDFLVKQSPYAHLEDRWLRLIEARLTGFPLQDSVPRSFGLLAGDHIVLTDFFNAATTLHREILRAAMPLGGYHRRARALSERAYGLGSWLAQFQRAVDTGARAPLEEEEEEVRTRLIEIDLLSLAERDRVLCRVREASRELGPVRVLLSHGDFAPRNVLLTDTGPKVIDWEMVHERPRVFLFDMHHFRVALARWRGLPGISAAVIDACDKGFLAGYRACCPYADETGAVWRPARLVVLVTVLSRQLRAMRRQPWMARLTGKHRFLRQLCQAIREEL